MSIGIAAILALIVVLTIEFSFRKIFVGHPKLKWIISLTQIVLTFAITIFSIVTTMLGTGEIRAEIIWEDSIPGNRNLSSTEEAPAYLLETELEKTSRPVYLKLETSGKYNASLELSMYDPRGNLMFYLPPDTQIFCSPGSMPCSPKVYKLPIIDGGTYKIEIKSLTPWAKGIDITLFQSEWLDKK
jgi:hypothetical protein